MHGRRQGCGDDSSVVRGHGIEDLRKWGLEIGFAALSSGSGFGGAGFRLRTCVMFSLRTSSLVQG